MGKEEARVGLGLGSEPWGLGGHIPLPGRPRYVLRAMGALLILPQDAPVDLALPLGSAPAFSRASAPTARLLDAIRWSGRSPPQVSTWTEGKSTVSGTLLSGEEECRVLR